MDEYLECAAERECKRTMERSLKNMRDVGPALQASNSMGTIRRWFHFHTNLQPRLDRLSHLDDFLSWAQKMGVHYDGIAVKDSEMGFSLVATQNLSDDRIVVRVPRNAILSMESPSVVDALRWSRVLS